MKAITIWQPYAQAIALGLKKYETRRWSTKYRGKIAIHCSVKKLSPDCRALAEKYGIADKLNYGTVIAICDLVDCILMTDDFIKQQSQTELDFGNWVVGNYAWKLNILEILSVSYKIKGRQGLWNIKMCPISDTNIDSV